MEGLGLVEDVWQAWSNMINGPFDAQLEATRRRQVSTPVIFREDGVARELYPDQGIIAVGNSYCLNNPLD